MLLPVPYPHVRGAHEEDNYLQWTLTFYDEESAELYPSVTFAGEVD